jgi:hypothetical protein
MQKTNVSLYNETGKIHIIEDIVVSGKNDTTQIDISSLPQDFGNVKAVFLNEGEHAYAKIRFDEASTKWFIKNLHLVEDSLTRGAVGRYFHMAVLERSMTSVQYLEFIFNQVPIETVDRNTMVNLLKVKDLFANYLPQELIKENQDKLF